MALAYSLRAHGNMIADSVRSDAYERALRSTVRPDSVVLDIGTGTGFFAILAAKLGAKRVIAIESSDMIELAKGVAAANACHGIEFIHGLSTQVDIPEKADVIVSDLHGVMPYYQGHLISMMDARRRFLAPGGVLVPREETVWAACVAAPDLHRPVTSPWSDNKYGLDMRAARALAANQWGRAVIAGDRLVSAPVRCATIDYATVEATDLDVTLELTATRSVEAHGLCAWFDSVLADGVAFSNAPADHSLVYGSAFFPWPEAVALEVGDRIVARLHARHTHGDYLWTWESRILRAESQLARFLQSDFFSEPLAPERVRRHAADHVATLCDDGRIDAMILTLMERSLPLGEIAGRVAERFASSFPRRQDALARVAEMSARYGGGAATNSHADD